ncbi:unnamed protein product [Thelazia callipaeda]|uniref:Ovule protein n=1 Tax=Thelazia callipaeda TaxID=103827 RepID=A0A0N5CYN3_THECL|nr:unnamed protein product [Thelazia callipaeda]
MEVRDISLECNASSPFQSSNINYLPIPSCQQSTSASAFSSPAFTSFTPFIINPEPSNDMKSNIVVHNPLSAMATQCFGHESLTIARPTTTMPPNPNQLFYGASHFGLSQLVFFLILGLIKVL